MVVAKKWIYAKPFEGLPKDENFRLEEETLPEPGENGWLKPGKTVRASKTTFHLSDVLFLLLLL